jgi:hypothetical protein
MRWVVLAVIWLCATILTVGFEFRETWGVIPNLLWTLAACAALYDFYLWRVVHTATFTLDDLSLGYRDRYLKVTVAWADVTDLTPTNLRARNGRTVFFKLGLAAIENSDEFVETVVKSAGLVVVPRGGGPARFWSRSPRDAQSAGAPS